MYVFLPPPFCTMYENHKAELRSTSRDRRRAAWSRAEIARGAVLPLQDPLTPLQSHRADALEIQRAADVSRDHRSNREPHRDSKEPPMFRARGKGAAESHAEPPSSSLEQPRATQSHAESEALLDFFSPYNGPLCFSYNKSY